MRVWWRFEREERKVGGSNSGVRNDARERGFGKGRLESSFESASDSSEPPSYIVYTNKSVRTNNPFFFPQIM